MFLYLFNKREKPKFLSYRWLKVWAKRVLRGGDLIKIYFRVVCLRARGSDIAQLVVVESIHVVGDPRNLQIGYGSFIGVGSELFAHAPIQIGENVVINSAVKILTAGHKVRDPNWFSYSKPICIKRNAWIATGAIILPGVTIGEGAVVGAGAVVRRDVPDFALAYGNPEVLVENIRPNQLKYSAVALCAPFEAWLGGV